MTDEFIPDHNTVQPEDLTPAAEAELLIQTKFPEEEFPLPDQTPEDQGKNQEEPDGNVN